MEALTDVSELCDRLRRLEPPILVAVEGFAGAGKSSLAAALGKDMPAPVIHTDEYVEGEDESLPYSQRLNYDRVAVALRSAQCGASVVIIDGICLRESLRRLGVSASFFVYLKLIAPNGLWHDGLHLEDFDAEGEDHDRREPHCSDFRYHLTERPHEQANVEFRRIDA